MELSFSTWNILANRFTNYNLGQKNNENKNQMKNRYLSIIIILQQLQKDIYFLQEVDNHFYYLIESSELQKDYLISYRYHKSWVQEKNKDDIGILIMIKKKIKWKVDTSLNQKLLDMYSPNSTLLQSRGLISGIYDFIELTDNGENGNQRKFSQILILKNNNNQYLFLINMHLEGRPDFYELRKNEFILSYQACQKFIQHNLSQYKNQCYYLIAGDFNEPDQSIVEQQLISGLPLSLINSDSLEITSFTKYVTDKANNTRQIIDNLQKLDYFITSPKVKLLSYNTLPKDSIRDFPNWEISFVTKHGQQVVCNQANWPSDHKILNFDIKIPQIKKRSHHSEKKKKDVVDKLLKKSSKLLQRRKKI